MLVALALLAPTLALAYGDPQSFLGGFVGPALVTSTGGGSYLTYGGRLGIGLGRSHSAIGSLGAYVGTFQTAQTVSAVTETGQIIPIFLEFVARRAFGSGLYFGARGGVVIESISAQSASTSVSGSGVSFGFAPVLGYEIELASAVSLGVDLSWLTKMSGSLTLPGIGAFNYDMAQAFVPAATLNIQF